MSWCEYLTPCPFCSDESIMVGDYECSQCQHHQQMVHKPNSKLELLKCCDYIRYNMIAAEGFVICNKTDEL